jgi:hypothetical protein
MWFDTAIQTHRGTKTIARDGKSVRRYPAGIALAALALLAVGTPRAQPGFQAPLAFDAGSNPVSVAVGDFNRDGIPDLAVANHDSTNVSVLLGKGDGTFQAAVNYVTGDGPYSVAVGDFNGDGIPDVVVANEYSNTVSVLLGKGEGTFQVAVTTLWGLGPVAWR